MESTLEAASTSPDLPARRRRAFIAAGLGWGLDGFDWTMYAFALTAILASLRISVAAGGLVASASLVASAVGGIVGGVLADRFGRVRVLTWVILGYALFTALTATSQNLTQLYLWRLLEGLAFGSEWAVGAALLAEYAIPAHRGKTMGWLQSSYAIGWALSTTAYLLLFIAFPPHVAWRYLFLVGVLPAVAAFFIRRTVRDRVKTGAASTALAFPLLFRRDLIRTTIISTVLGVGVQGIYYSVFIFLPLFLKTVRHLSVVNTAGYTWVVIVGSFVGYVLAGYIHDAVGRRPAFTLYFAGSALSIWLFVTLPITGFVTTFVVSFFLGFFASGSAAGMGAYLAELFPTVMRASGQGFAYNVGRGVAAFAPGFIGVFSSRLGLGTAILVVGWGAVILAAAAVWMLPETRGREIVEPHLDALQASGATA